MLNDLSSTIYGQVGVIGAEFCKKIKKNVKGKYRRISQIAYQPKSVGKMADFDILILCISLNSS